ncbi:MAG: rhodanese-like domain-containing protein [Desulfuromonas sp.]|nr:MAG: rhodanese-like domain-containing protein [Desulfuromonas sp.]
MRPDQLNALLNGVDCPIILDVRSGFEYRSGHLPGAIHLPFWQVLFKTTTIPGGRKSQLVLYCEHGPRAVLARGMLQLRGFRRHELLQGHMYAWRRAGRRIER